MHIAAICLIIDAYCCWFFFRRFLSSSRLFLLHDIFTPLLSHTLSDHLAFFLDWFLAIDCLSFLSLFRRQLSLPCCYGSAAADISADDISLAWFSLMLSLYFHFLLFAIFSPYAMLISRCFLLMLPCWCLLMMIIYFRHFHDAAWLRHFRATLMLIFRYFLLMMDAMMPPCHTCCLMMLSSFDATPCRFLSPCFLRCFCWLMLLFSFAAISCFFAFAPILIALIIFWLFSLIIDAAFIYAFRLLMLHYFRCWCWWCFSIFCWFRWYLLIIFFSFFFSLDVFLLRYSYNIVIHIIDTLLRIDWLLMMLFAPFHLISLLFDDCFSSSSMRFLFFFILLIFDGDIFAADITLMPSLISRDAADAFDDDCFRHVAFHASLFLRFRHFLLFASSIFSLIIDIITRHIIFRFDCHWYFAIAASFRHFRHFLPLSLSLFAFMMNNGAMTLFIDYWWRYWYYYFFDFRCHFADFLSFSALRFSLIISLLFRFLLHTHIYYDSPYWFRCYAFAVSLLHALPYMLLYIFCFFAAFAFIIFGDASMLIIVYHLFHFLIVLADDISFIYFRHYYYIAIIDIIAADYAMIRHYALLPFIIDIFIFRWCWCRYCCRCCCWFSPDADFRFIHYAPLIDYLIIADAWCCFRCAFAMLIAIIDIIIAIIASSFWLIFICHWFAAAITLMIIIDMILFSPLDAIILRCCHAALIALLRCRACHLLMPCWCHYFHTPCCFSDWFSWYFLQNISFSSSYYYFHW